MCGAVDGSYDSDFACRNIPATTCATADICTMLLVCCDCLLLISVLPDCSWSC